MNRLVKDGYRKARKTYRCDGKEHIRSFLHDSDVDHTCLGINKGDKHYFQVGAIEDTLQTWRTCDGCKDCLDEHELWGAE